MLQETSFAEVKARAGELFVEEREAVALVEPG